MSSPASAEDATAATMKMTAKFKETLEACGGALDPELRRDLLEVLSGLEGELQARDLAIGALKVIAFLPVCQKLLSPKCPSLQSDCLRNLLINLGNPQQGYLRDPVFALSRDRQMNPAVRGGSTAAAVDNLQLQCLETVSSKQKQALQKIAACLRESGKSFSSGSRRLPPTA